MNRREIVHTHDWLKFSRKTVLLSAWRAEDLSDTFPPPWQYFSIEKKHIHASLEKKLICPLYPISARSRFNVPYHYVNEYIRHIHLLIYVFLCVHTQSTPHEYHARSSMAANALGFNQQSIYLYLWREASIRTFMMWTSSIEWMNITRISAVRLMPIPKIEKRVYTAAPNAKSMFDGVRWCVAAANALLGLFFIYSPFVSDFNFARSLWHMLRAQLWFLMLLPLELRSVWHFHVIQKMLICCFAHERDRWVVTGENEKNRDEKPYAL